MQVNTQMSPTLSPKQDRGPPETVGTLTFYVPKQCWKIPALPGRMLHERPSKISSPLESFGTLPQGKREAWGKMRAGETSRKRPW